jgi:hypothetical protein
VLVIPSISKEYLSVPVAGTNLDGTEPVELAVIPVSTEEPADDDWHTAAWVSGEARVLIGPGTALDLANGTYRVWVRLTASPEIPVIRAGSLKIT